MMYWFAVAPDRPEILDVGIRNGLWGVVEADWDEIEGLEPGDFILFFHRDDGFVLCEVESEPYTERVPVWSEVDFPHRVRISDPAETDRYAHLGEVHDCLLDPETGEPYSSTAAAASALEAAAGTFRPLADREIRCLFGRLGWTPPPDVVSAPAPEAEGAPEEPTEPAEGEEPAEPAVSGAAPDAVPAAEPGTDADDETPAVAAPVDGGSGPAEAEPAGGEEPTEEAEPEPEEGGEEEPAPEETEPGEEAATGPRVILAPAAGNEASRRRWKETVEEGVPLDRVEDHLPGDELDRLREAADGGRVRVWGTAPARDERSRAQWTDSGPGDVMLFSGGGEIFASARVLAKHRDPDLAENLWGRRDDGETWEFLFFATAPAPQAVAYESLNDVAGYEAGYRIPRLNVLGPGRSRRILRAFPAFTHVPDDTGEAAVEEDEAAGTVAEAGESTGEPNDGEPASAAEAEDEPPEEPAATEVEAVPPEETAPETPGASEEAEPEAPAAEVKVEGAGEPAPATGEAEPEEAAEHVGVGAMDGVRLRTLLFGRRELGRCALCGRLLPVDLLSVVYVKPLEACTPEELDDVGNNVLPGCRMGCAGLFREGFVVVDEGIVRPGRDEPLTDPVEERIEELVGTRCEYWHSGSEPYFRWHVSEHRQR